MKKLFSGCCCPIVYYKQFLIVGKKGLTIYKEVEPNVFEEYFHTSKINKTKARKLFQETYFENDLIILYQASYDKGTDTWLVSNNKISIKFGGSAYAIINNSDGKVLALWHDK